MEAFAVTWRRRGRLPGVVPDGVRVHQRPMPARPLHLAWAHLPGPALEWFVGPADVVHGTNFVVPPCRRAAPVVTVHDLTSLRYPELSDPSTLGFPRMVRRAVVRGAWVHTPSQFVADEVVAELGADPRRVRAVHHGVDGAPDLPGSGPPPGLPAGARRYVLAVGTVEPRKDYPGLVRAFAAVAPSHPDVALVIAGADGWGAEAFHRALWDCPVAGRVGAARVRPRRGSAAVAGGRGGVGVPFAVRGLRLPPARGHGGRCPRGRHLGRGHSRGGGRGGAARGTG